MISSALKDAVALEFQYLVSTCFDRLPHVDIYTCHFNQVPKRFLERNSKSSLDKIKKNGSKIFTLSESIKRVFLCLYSFVYINHLSLESKIVPKKFIRQKPITQLT